jgi:hypothetical protein
LNRFFDGSSTIDAMPVSNRTATDEALIVPTLEDLQSSRSEVVEMPNNNSPRYSRTPFAITIKLPPLTTPPAAATPQSTAPGTVTPPSSSER